MITRLSLRRVPARTAALAAAVLLPLALTGCAGTDEAAPDLAAASATPSPAALPTSAPSPSPDTDAEDTEDPVDDATLVAVTVAGGTVSGDTGRAKVALGDRVRLTVTSDVADEIHVHGYDLFENAVAGQAVTLEFVADKPGVFEVELEESRVVLTRLQIQ